MTNSNKKQIIDDARFNELDPHIQNVITTTRIRDEVVKVYQAKMGSFIRLSPYYSLNSKQILRLVQDPKFVEIRPGMNLECSCLEIILKW